MKPVFQTRRFDIFCAHCERNPELGQPRDVYLAFSRDDDVPRPQYTVTIWPTCPCFDDDDNHVKGVQSYIEWCEVAEDFRRAGIATEVLLGLQDYVAPLVGDGKTDSGRALAAARFVDQTNRMMCGVPTSEEE